MLTFEIRHELTIHSCPFLMLSFSVVGSELENCLLKLNVFMFGIGFPGKESACNVGDPGLIPGLESSLREGIGYPPPVFSDFPGSSDGKESAYNAGDLCSIPGLGRSLGGRHGNPPQYSCLKNPSGQRSLTGYSPWGLQGVGHD